MDSKEDLKSNLLGKYSTPMKVIVVGFLTLLLLIPLSMIRSTINERQESKQFAVNDITSKWGGEQTIAGPLIVVPYKKVVKEKGEEMLKEYSLLLLPETLDIESSVGAEDRRRGIYDVSVYNADVNIKSVFDSEELKKFIIDPALVEWGNMHVVMGLSDLKGIDEHVVLEVGDNKITFNSGIHLEGLAERAYGSDSYGGPNTTTSFSVGLNADLDSLGRKLVDEGKLEMNISLKLSGSQALYMLPVGKTTSVAMNSDWKTPKFDGEFLPNSYDVKDSGFTSEWKVLDLNRNYGQLVAADNIEVLNQMDFSRFGVKFIQSVDQYQQNMRSVKYAILIILLTFVVVFFIELFQKRPVNLFQYLLVGLALVLFYALLLSLTEVIGYNLAYLVAAAMTTLLIMFHMMSIIDRKRGITIGVLLAALYVFVFVLIQMENYALLTGSLGLFVILGVIMHYSKRLRM